MKKNKLLKTLGCFTLIAAPIIITPIVLTTSCSSITGSITITGVSESYKIKIHTGDVIINPVAKIDINSENKNIVFSIKTKEPDANAHIDPLTGSVIYTPTVVGTFNLTIVATSSANPEIFAEIATSISVEDQIQVNSIDRIILTQSGHDIIGGHGTDQGVFSYETPWERSSKVSWNLNFKNIFVSFLINGESDVVPYSSISDSITLDSKCYIETSKGDELSKGVLTFADGEFTSTEALWVEAFNFPNSSSVGWQGMNPTSPGNFYFYGKEVITYSLKTDGAALYKATLTGFRANSPY